MQLAWLLIAGCVCSVGAETPATAVATAVAETSWNMTMFLAHEFDPGCRPTYSSGYTKVGFKTVWFESPATREEASLRYQRCTQVHHSPTHINLTLTVNEVNWIESPEQHFGARVTVDSAWIDSNASRISPELLWQPQIEFLEAEAQLKSSTIRVDLFPSLDAQSGLAPPLVRLSQQFEVDVAQWGWRFRRFPFDTQELRLEIGMKSRNSMIQEASPLASHPDPGEPLHGFECKASWTAQEVTGELRSTNDQLVPIFVESHVVFTMQIKRLAHLLIGAYVLPVLASLLIGWSGFFFFSHAASTAALLVAVPFLVVSVHLRWSTELTPPTSWSWLDALFTAQIIIIAFSIVALACCVYAKLTWECEKEVGAIICSFRVLFLPHALLLSASLATILNLWDSQWRFIVAFMLVVGFAMFHGALVAHYVRNIESEDDYGDDVNQSKRTTTQGTPNPFMNQARKDFPTM